MEDLIDTLEAKINEFNRVTKNALVQNYTLPKSAKVVTKAVVMEDYNGYPVFKVTGTFQLPFEVVAKHFVDTSTGLSPIKTEILDMYENKEDRIHFGTIKSTYELPAKEFGLTNTSSKEFMYVQQGEVSDDDPSKTLGLSVMTLETQSVDNLFSCLQLRAVSAGVTDFTISSATKIHNTNNSLMRAFQIQQIVAHYEMLGENLSH